jgi:hypothetical protein
LDYIKIGLREIYCDGKWMKLAQNSLCPVAGFGISGVELRVLFSQLLKVNGRTVVLILAKTACFHIAISTSFHSMLQTTRAEKLNKPRRK